MGATIRSFSKALSTTVSSPLLILITLVTLTASMIIGAMFSLIPLFGQLVAVPLAATIMAGILGMVGYAAYQNRAVDTSDYFESIKDRGPKVFAVVLVEQLLYFFISVFFFFLLFFAFGLGGAFLEQTAQNPEQAAAVSASLGFGFIAAFGLFILPLGLAGPFLNRLHRIQNKQQLSQGALVSGSLPPLDCSCLPTSL